MTDVTGVNEVTRVDCDGCPVRDRDRAYGGGSGWHRSADSACADCVIGLLLGVPRPRRPDLSKPDLNKPDLGKPGLSKRKAG